MVKIGEEVPTATAVPAKPWYMSKSLWVAGATALSGFLSAAVTIPEVTNNPKVLSVMLAASGALMFVLRFFSTSQITK